MIAAERACVPLTLVAALVFGSGAAVVDDEPEPRGRDARARAYGSELELLAEGYFNAAKDRFSLAKKRSFGNRPYLDWTYRRVNGEWTSGREWGYRTVNRTAFFHHNFGEGRDVEFRVCVQVDLAIDPCSRWARGIA